MVDNKKSLCFLLGLQMFLSNIIMTWFAIKDLTEQRRIVHESMHADFRFGLGSGDARSTVFTFIQLRLIDANIVEGLIQFLIK